jgi:phosphoglycerate dehydrogenase-like enzyme
VLTTQLLPTGIDAEYVSLDDLLAKRWVMVSGPDRDSDYVVPHCPLNESTRNMFDRAVFEKMKRTAVFINTTRGGIVSQDDLVYALQV